MNGWTRSSLEVWNVICSAVARGRIPALSARIARMAEEDPSPELGTTGSFAMLPGNPLFEGAIAAIGFDDGVTRRLLTSVVNTIGTYPDELTPDELGVLLPEIDRRLRDLAPPDRVDDAMRSLAHLLLGWVAR